MHRLALAVTCGLAIVLGGVDGGIAQAHRSSIAYISANITPTGEVTLTVQLSSRDLYEVLALDRDRDASDEEITTGQARIAAYVAERLHVSDGPRPCAMGDAHLDIVHQADRFARLALTARCGGPIAVFALDDNLFFDLDPAHTALVEVHAGGDTVRRELRVGETRFEWELGTATSSVGVIDFIEEGVKHIFTGVDHICFLVALLLVVVIARKPGSDGGDVARTPHQALVMVLSTVTAFTLAHSLTLIAAALGWIHVPSRVVESTIALSIVYVAVENLLSRSPRSRWPLAFGFGLFHGMGFATALAPILPPSGVIAPLLAFNLGVELGQLAIVAALLPVLVLITRVSVVGYRRYVLRGGSLIVAAFGVIWLIERVFDVTILPFFKG